MSFGIIAATAVTAGAGMVAANKQSKAAKAAAEAGKQVPIDIADVSQRAEDQATRNLTRSIALEQQYDPYVAQARKTAAMNFNNVIGGQDPLTGRANELALQMANASPVQFDSPALREAVSQAMAASKGPAIPYAELPVEISNQATRRALSTAGNVGGGLNLGRDLVARDLGLTSLQLGQQAEQNRMNRIAQLLGAGGAELGMNRGNAEFGVAQQQQNIGNLTQLGGQDFSRALSAAQFTQALQRPVVGLDPSAIANLATGNTATENQNRLNQANLIQQQGNIQANMYGQLGGALGSGLSAYLGRPQQSTSNGPTSTYADFLKNNPKPGASPNYAVNYTPNPNIGNVG